MAVGTVDDDVDNINRLKTVGRVGAIVAFSRAHAIAAAVLAAVIVAVALRAPSMRQPLLEYQAFRQTQTAYAALIYHEEGIDLLRTPVPVLGPPYDVPFEFPLVQAAGSVLMDVFRPDVAMRLTGLSFFALTAGLLWLLLRRQTDSLTAAGGLVFFVLSPFSIVWSRASSIEYAATAAALAFVVAAIGWRTSGRAALFWIALVAAVLGMLIKPTTVAFWYLPVLAVHPSGAFGRGLGLGEAKERYFNLALLALVVVPFAVGFAWVAYADWVKSQSPATIWLTSSSLVPWNFGSVADRLNLGMWSTVLGRYSHLLIGDGFIMLLPIAAIAINRARDRLLWLSLVAVSLLAPAVFFNLYAVHDYYLAAISPAVAAILGLASAWLWRAARDRVTKAAVLAALIVAIGVTASTSLSYVVSIYQPVSDPEGALDFAAAISAAQVDPGEDVVVVGYDWSPAALYYARMRGQMLPEPILKAEFVESVAARGDAIIASFNPDVDPLWVLRAWRWTGILGPRVFVGGGQPEELRGAHVVAGDDLAALAEARPTSRSLVSSSIRVQCDDPSGTIVPRGSRGTWLRFAAGIPRDAKLRPGDDQPPLPAREVVVIGQSPSSAQVRLTCWGAPWLTLLEGFDAPLPNTGARTLRDPTQGYGLVRAS